jgi:hypothetical protein
MIFIASLLFRRVVHVVELSSGVLSALDSFLNDFLVLFEIFVHQFGGIGIQWFLQILGINVLKQV